jgi:cell division protein ZipA
LAELRWILLGLGTLAIGAIWWWSARRSAQAPGNAELRESTVVPVPAPGAAEAPHTEKRAPTSGASRLGEARASSAESRAAAGEARASPLERASPVERAEWSISPLEPLSIRTADFEDVPDMELPMLTRPDPLDITQDLGTVRAAAEPSAPKSAGPAAPSAAPAMQPGGAAHIPTLASPPGASPPRPRASPESSDRLDAVAPANSSERQKIVTLRVCAVGETRWSGAALMSTLEQHGLAYGRYQVYHRKHIDGRSIFCVASLIEPGTFDAARMANDQFRGVSMFAVLPGPLEPLQTVDALFATARELARELTGTVQDVKGIPFSPQRVAALREDVARFQAQLG